MTERYPIRPISPDEFDAFHLVEEHAFHGGPLPGYAASHGCVRLKVSFEADNPAARDLYLGAGFAPESTSQTYTNQRA